MNCLSRSFKYNDMKDQIFLEVVNDYDYVYEETMVDPINFLRTDEDMAGKPAVCAILVFENDGCLLDSQRGIDFDKEGTISENTSCMQEGVYMYNGELSMEQVSEELTKQGYKVE